MTILRNILAVVAGLFIGAMVNSYIVGISGDVIPLPEGVDPNDVESLKENMQHFAPINFLMPFLAHALGTLVGAIIAGLVAVNRKLIFSMVIGGFFLLGGVALVFMLPGPTWFNITDVLLAYIPMGYLGYLIAVKIGGPDKVEKPDVLNM